VVGYFNPRARAGRDAEHHGRWVYAYRVSIHAPARGATYLESQKINQELFQSTRPRGARP